MTPLSSLLWGSYLKPTLVCQKRKGEEKQKMWNQGYTRYKITNKGQVWKGGSQRRAASVDFPAARWFRPDSWFHLKASMHSFLISIKWKGKLHIYKHKMWRTSTNRRPKANHKNGPRTTPRCTYKKPKPIWKKCSCHLYLKPLIGICLQRDNLSQGTCYMMFTRSRKKLVFCFLQAAILPQGPAENGEARCARRPKGISFPTRDTCTHSAKKPPEEIRKQGLEGDHGSTKLPQLNFWSHTVLPKRMPRNHCFCTSVILYTSLSLDRWKEPRSFCNPAFRWPTSSFHLPMEGWYLSCNTSGTQNAFFSFTFTTLQSASKPNSGSNYMTIF